MQNLNFSILPNLLLTDQIVTQDELDTVNQLTVNNQNEILATKDELTTNTNFLQQQITTNYGDLLNKVNNIVSQNIVDFTIEGIDVKNNTLTTDKLIDNINIDPKLQLNTINGNKLQDLSIVNSKLADNTIALNKLQQQPSNLFQVLSTDGSGNFIMTKINDSYIVNNSISGAKILNNSIDYRFKLLNFDILQQDRHITYTGQENNLIKFNNLNQVVSGKLTNDNIDNLSISGSKIEPNTIARSKLQGLIDAPTYDKQLVSSSLLTSGNLQHQNLEQVHFDNITANSINIDNALTQNTLNANKLVNQSITFGKIANNAIQNYHIADGQVYQSKIQNGSINDTKLADNAVNTTKIGDNQVTQPKLALEMDLNSNILINSLNADRILDNSITEDKLLISNLPQNNQILGYQTGLGLTWKDDQNYNDITSQPNQIFNTSATNQKQYSKIRQDLFDINSLSGTMFVDGQISGLKITPGTINDQRLATNSVTTDKIQDQNVTQPKLALDMNINANVLDNTFNGTKILDSSINETKLNIINNPTTNQYLQWNGTNLQWQTVNSNPYPNPTDVDQMLVHTGGLNYTWQKVTNQQLTQGGLIQPKHIISGDTRQLNKLLTYTNDDNFGWQYVIDLLSGVVGINQLAIVGTPQNQQFLQYINDGINPPYLQFGSLTASLPDNYFANQIIVNSKFAQDSIQTRNLFFLGGQRISNGQQVLASTDTGIFQRQIFGQYPNSNTFNNARMGFFLQGSESTCAYSDILKLGNALYGQPLTEAGVTPPASMQGSYSQCLYFNYGGEPCMIVACPNKDKFCISTAQDADTQFSYGGYIVEFRDEDTISNETSSVCYITNNTFFSPSSEKKKCSIRDRQICGKFNELMKIKAKSFKWKEYQDLIDDKETFATYSKKKQERIIRKAQKTTQGIIIEDLCKEGIFKDCYLQKYDGQDYEQYKQEFLNNPSMHTGIDITQLCWNIVFSVQDMYLSEIKPLKDEIHYYQKPEERKELIQKIINISQTEALDIINQQQIIPMSSIRPALSDGLLIQKDGHIQTLSSVDIFQLDSCVSLIQDLQNENQQQQQQINLLTNTINNLVNTVNNLKTQITTLTTNQQSIQMRLSSNNI